MKKTTKRGRQLLIWMLVLSFMTVVFSSSAMAATDPNAITKVKLHVTNSSGEVIFTSSEETKYTISEQTGDKVQVGDTDTEFKVTVSAKEGYYYSNIKSKSNVSFSGTNSGVKCTDISVNYTTNVVTIWIEVATVKGRLSEPSSVWWEDDDDDFGTAEWDEVEGARRYRITINDNEIETTDTWEDLRPYLKWGQNNYFKVKAISGKTGVSDSSYVKSDALDLKKDGPYWDDYHDTWTGRPDYSTRPNYTKSGWNQYSDGSWYYIGDNGQIQTGFIWDNGYRYYLSEDSANKGAMVTGWKKINGYWYFFTPNNRPIGHMLTNTSIKSANGKFDYKVDNEGKMLISCWGEIWEQGNNGQQYKNWYYVNKNGNIVYDDEITYEKNNYRVDARGYMITGWYQNNKGEWYFYYDNGIKAKNTILWGQYRLDNNGKWIQ